MGDVIYVVRGSCISVEYLQVPCYMYYMHEYVCIFVYTIMYVHVAKGVPVWHTLTYMPMSPSVCLRVCLYASSSRVWTACIAFCVIALGLACVLYAKAAEGG